MYAGNSRLVQLRFGAQVVAVRLEEGRLEEVIAALENIDSLGVTVPEWRAMLVTALAQAQRRDEAIAVLHDLDDAELFSSGRPTAPLAVRHVAEACRLLGDATRAASALTFVRPWSGQVLLVLPGASIEGAGDRSVGHLLAVLGRLDEADAAYSAAAQLDAPPGSRRWQPARSTGMPARCSNGVVPATMNALTSCWRTLPRSPSGSACTYSTSKRRSSPSTRRLRHAEPER